MNNKLLIQASSALLLSITLSVTAITTKPTITIFATGGTIAGSAASNKDTAHYTAGTIGVQTLIHAVPELQDIATIRGAQVANVDSNDINQKILLSLVKKLNSTLSRVDQVGAVITHGTDTIEETAFFLDLTMKTDKPIVLVGAMRPATAISADGPMNLLEAVELAVNKAAKGRGVMVVLNDRITSGFYMSKTNATTLDAFKTNEQGALGIFADNAPHFYYSAAMPINKPYFDVSGKTTLPKVAIIYDYQGMDDNTLYSAVKSGAKGLVIAASGNGSLPETLGKAVATLMARGIPVILASKTGSGYVTAKEKGIGSGLYSPTKARILLSLVLSEGADMNRVRSYFEGKPSTLS